MGGSAGALKTLWKRIVDLQPIVREYVYHPEFGGSFCLKAVLPALVPGLGYADLDVKDGRTASALLEALLLHGDAMDPTERAELRRKLLAYCERDVGQRFLNLENACRLRIQLRNGV
jgi:hypothetical protein